MRVRSEVALRYARTSVITHVANPDSRPQEATFRMLLPDTAFISGFTMILSGNSYKAHVKEKNEAKQLYSEAVSRGVSAAHVATKARDSNHFTVSVNVEGNTTAIFELRYEDMLVSRNGLYSHVINLHPGALVPVMEVVVHIKESQQITKLNVPELRTGNEIDETLKDTQNSLAVIRNGTNNREVTVTFTPDLIEQRRLAKIYMEKSKENGTSTAFGQFVVEYDVERSNNGEILVNDGYFVHFLAPTSLPPLSKHVVFVLDTSGSMEGRKLEQMRKAMDTILSDLNPYDYFSIVEFSHFIQVHDLKEADEPAPRKKEYWEYNSIEADAPYTLVPPSLASAENIAKAKIVASRLDYTGGTNIYGALEAAIKITKKGVDQRNKTVANNTDATNLTENNMTKGVEPIIIFLTDGVAVDGETNTDRIISKITEKNSGDKRAALYSIAFGEDADRPFLRMVSLRNEGFMRHVYESSDAALQLHDFYRQVSSPLLSHVQFQYPAKQIKEGSVSRTQFRTIYGGSEVAVVGQIAADATEITPRVFGFYGSEDGQTLKRYEVTPRVAVRRTRDEHLPLERLWAYLTIKQLLDKRDAGDHSTDENSPEKKALDIALKYAFVTPLTSLVVVKPDESHAVDVESVDVTTTTTTTTTPAPPAPLVYHSEANFIDYENSAQPMSFHSYDDSMINHRAGLRGQDHDLHSVYGNHIIGGGSRTLGGDSVYSGMTSNLLSGDYTRLASYNSNRISGGYDHRSSVLTSGSRYSSSRRWPAYYHSRKNTKTLTRKYHLEGFRWTSLLLNASAEALTVLGANGEQVFLKLTTDVNPPVAADGDVECSNSLFAPWATDHASSVCVYVTRCYAARRITTDDYQHSYCVVNDGFAGVCCPPDQVLN
ncbi:inter-alpha-trypsin inhibitor heavy chain H4 isoform X2 [Bicyclus anynana]|uniref:Inter-alpha-trypsin inhibitor heavy chain H4 isoform X2 n=1 Tax=Bicyclus anynana TaxID=110368 RepID=A0A6J1PB58_BICAN|nr:inter-alpha-trypsin inhibitor heavy chain H4 isoform X2 [Bicyclus anynana]